MTCGLSLRRIWHLVLCAASALAVALLAPGCRRTSGSGTAVARPVLPSSPPVAAGPDDLFEDVTAKSGIDFVHQLASGKLTNIVESVGAGGVVFDFDGDGLLDVYLVNSGPHAVVSPAPDGAPRFPNRLYRNRGDGTFEDVTKKAGVEGSGYGAMAAAADYDNDGHVDLFVVNVGTEPPLPQPRRRDVRGRHGQGRARTGGNGRRGDFPRLRQRRAPRPLRRELPHVRPELQAPLQPRRLSRPARLQGRVQRPLPEPRGRDLRGREREGGSQHPGEPRDGRGGLRRERGRLPRPLRHERRHPEPRCFSTTARATSGTRASRWGWRSARTARRRARWARRSGT